MNCFGSNTPRNVAGIVQWRAMMFDDRPKSESPPEHADAGWFRSPNRREHYIAAWLFVGFGLFFAVLFWVERNFWFRWVVLALAVWSVWHGLRHAADARKSET
jgi:hypothetical protein